MNVRFDELALRSTEKSSPLETLTPDDEDEDVDDEADIDEEAADDDDAVACVAWHVVTTRCRLPDHGCPEAGTNEA
jgi:hypothetical protein